MREADGIRAAKPSRTMAPDAVQTRIIDAFAEHGDAFNQFDYLLQLASELDELSEQDKRPEALIKGCQSQVWIHLSWTPESEGAASTLCLRGDSDTLMVRGVIRILELMFAGCSPDEVLGCPLRFVEETELASIFDSQRKTGVSAIMDALRASARRQQSLRQDEKQEGNAMDTTNRPTLKAQLEAAEKRADAILEKLKSPATETDEFTRLVGEFVRCKFFLEPDECTTDNILELANISVEKLLRVNDRSVKLAQGSNTCTNQSSTDIKKVLLSLTLQRALAVKLTPDESANLETIEQLADALYARRACADMVSCAISAERREG